MSWTWPIEALYLIDSLDGDHTKDTIDSERIVRFHIPQGLFVTPCTFLVQQADLEEKVHDCPTTTERVGDVHFQQRNHKDHPQTCQKSSNLSISNIPKKSSPSFAYFRIKHRKCQNLILDF